MSEEAPQPIREELTTEQAIDRTGLRGAMDIVGRLIAEVASKVTPTGYGLSNEEAKLRRLKKLQTEIIHTALSLLREMEAEKK